MIKARFSINLIWVSAEDYKNFDVIDGLDDDIAYLDIWPESI